MEALENYLLETNNEELPAGVFREWLAEWARDNRRRQHGLLLTSAHRAKGLEFDHVAILDGSWHTAGKGEDTDAPRRLYYVAMTRARKDPYPGQVRELQPISQIASQSPFSSGPAGAGPNPAGSCGNEAGIPEAQPEGRAAEFRRLQAPDHPVHRAIAGLSAGAPLRVRTNRNPWELTTVDGISVGQLAQAFKAPAESGGVSATVVAIALPGTGRSRKEGTKADSKASDGKW